MDWVLNKGQNISIACEEGLNQAVYIAVENLVADLGKVLDIRADVVRLSREDIDADDIGQGKYSIVICEKTLENKEQYEHRVENGTLFISGNDRRGIIYGIYELTEQLGVSPWYFFADVPVKKKDTFVYQDGYYKTDYPSVEYRGIFINDEEELDKWVRLHMGEDTIGVKTYEKIFELLLRLKANYIWPAMHVNSFNLKRENGELADRMGIVVGTSHCDMLMRSNNREWVPWIEKKGYTDVEYDYSIPGRNRDILDEYWRESVEQNKDFEVGYTLGMRGIHDSGFETRSLAGLEGEELRKAKIELLTTVINAQQKILSETLGKDTLKSFVPYKEVLELYDNGLEVPEDLTLIWTNDNYGYIRRYPGEKEKARKGGNGIYYHNSYWAPPGASYLFINSIPLAHTRNELYKAWNEGIRKVWVMNVGAIKPLEQEISFYLRFAWEVGKENAITEDVDVYLADWINRTFSGNHGKKMADILNGFAQLTNVRKIELLDSDVFSQTAYGDEATARMNEYKKMVLEANRIYRNLPKCEKPAFFQMCLMKLHAAYFTNAMYYYADRSALCTKQSKYQAAKRYTEYCRYYDDLRRKMLDYYNNVMCEGKWSGILTPEDFPPPRTAMFPACVIPLKRSEDKLVVTLWNQDKSIELNDYHEKWIELANSGDGELCCRVTMPDWVEACGGTKEALKNTDAKAGKNTFVIYVKAEERVLLKKKQGSEGGLSGLIEISCEHTSQCIEIGVTTVAEEAKNISHFGLSDKKNRLTKVSMEDGAMVSIEADEFEIVKMNAVDSEIQNGEASEKKSACDDSIDQDCSEILSGSGLSGSNQMAGVWKSIKRLGYGYGSLMEAQPYETEDKSSIGQKDYIDVENLIHSCNTKIKQSNTPDFGEKLKSALDSADEVKVYGEPLRYYYCLNEDSDCKVQIHRFPSLNSTGRIRALMVIDGSYAELIETEATDEWRGSWKNNILNNVDKITVSAGRLEAGVHALDIYAIDKYFAFSRINVYTKDIKDNQLGTFRGDNRLCAANIAGAPELELPLSLYGDTALRPRDVIYASANETGNTLLDTDIKVEQKCYGQPLTPAIILSEGIGIFMERNGVFKIDAASALAQTDFAYTQGNAWDYCVSESYGRTGLALHIRQRGIRYSDYKDAPSVHYHLLATGGEYKLWLLMKLESGDEADIGIGVDGWALDKSEINHGVRIGRYCAERVYRWVNAASLKLESGEHEISVCTFVSGIRFDRIYMTKGKELPPTDEKW